MRKSFTLVEVIIAVMILALVGVALLKSGAINISALERISKKDNFVDLTTIIVNHRNPDFNHLTKALEDFLPNLSIDDDELRKLLKEKFKYQEYEIKIKPPTMEEFEEINFSDEVEEDEEKEQFQSPIEISLIKLSLQNEEGGDYLYILELRE